MFDVNHDEGTRGYHITFENGWHASVQWGFGTYSENKFRRPHNIRPSPNAEVWAWRVDSDEHYPDQPLGWQNPAEVVEFLAKVSHFE